MAFVALQDATPADSLALDARAVHASFEARAAGTKTALRSAPNGFPSATWSSTTDGDWSDLAPPQRVGHAAIFDSLRDRMIVFGGHVDFSVASATRESWALSFVGGPTWNRLITSGELPDPAENHAVIHDAAQDRMLAIVAGGSGGVWALRLNDLVWTRISPSGAPPAAREGTSTVYDPLRDRLLVFGGYEFGLHGGTYHNEVWGLSLSGTPTWVQLSPSGTAPSPRFRHTAVYDPARDRMIVFGGSGPDASLNNEVWSLELSGDPTWLNLTPSGVAPTARDGSLSSFDAVTNRLLIYGGSRGPGNDVWALSLGEAPSWTQVIPNGPLPSPRPGASLVLDRARQHLLLYGGSWDGRGGETWSLALGPSPQWTEIGMVPPGRYRFSAVCDPAGDRMIVFGGISQARLQAGDPYLLGDLWSRDLGAFGEWTLLQPAGVFPPARGSHNSVMDPVRHRMIVFGGASATTDFNDVWQLSMDGAPTWSLLTPSGTPPLPRWAASAIYDPIRDRLVVFGGASSGVTAITVWNEVWTLSLGGTPAWSQIAPAGTPPSPRIEASAVYDPVRDRMLVFGGNSFAGVSDSVWALSFSPMPSWSVVAASGSPGGRDGHSAIYDPVLDRMVIFGGWFQQGTDVWALSLSGIPQWAELSPSGLGPAARAHQAAIYDAARNRMVLFGGLGQGSSPFDYNDTWALTWQIVVTAVLFSVQRAVAEPGIVHVTWVSASSNFVATVYRSQSGGPWLAMRTVSPDGAGRLIYEDRTVSPGSRYGYRIGVLEGMRESFYGEVWVDVPRGPEIRLRPNPARGDLVVSFSVFNSLPTQLSVFDLNGRRVIDRRLGVLGAGEHLVNLGEGRALPTGVYLFHLTQGGVGVSTRGVIVR